MADKARKRRALFKAEEPNVLLEEIEANNGLLFDRFNKQKVKKWEEIAERMTAVTAITSQVSPSLKLTLPLKNRFLPLQESTNEPATHAPLSPEMHPDKQCGQRPTMNPSPERQAVHASATRAPLSPKMRPDRRNGHPPPLHSPIDDDLQPHLSHSHNNNSSSTVSSLSDFPAEFKKLVYVGIKLASVSMIASPRHGHRLMTPKQRVPQPPPPY
ncbi:unnamed protein product [Boreogadus saida]